MKPKQARLGADAFTGFVIASVALALASFTWRLQGYTGMSPAAAPVSPGGEQTLDIAPVLALAPFGSASAVPLGEVDGSLKLHATFAAIPMNASVAMIASADGTVTSYGIGESVGGGVIEQILPEQVVLRTSSGLQTLSLGLEDQGLDRGGSLTPAAPAPSVTTSADLAPAPPAPSTAPAHPSSRSGADAIRSLIPESARQGTPPSPAASPRSPPEA